MSPRSRKCAMPQPRILMCPPDHYGIEYEINPWMNRSLGAVRELAFRQWKALRDTLVSRGVTVEMLDPRPGLPDLVFTANAGLVVRDTFLSSRFRHEVRARESPFFDQWVGQALGVRVLPLELVNTRFYHLDTCFCPLAPGEAVYFPEAFDDYGRRV